MRDPGAVVAGADFAQLVGAHPRHRRGIGLDVGGGSSADRDLRRHPAHRMRAATVAGLDQQFRVRLQERLRHRHLRALRQHPVAMRTQGLDVGKDVVPAAAVEADDALAQRMQDLVHLEGRGQRLDQHRHFHLPLRQPERVLDVRQHVLPQRRLFHRLQLGQVEIRAAILRGERAGVVEGEQAEVEQAGAGALSVDQHVLLVEVPAARAHDQHRLFRERFQRIGFSVGLPFCSRRGERERAGDGFAQRALADEQVVPGRRRRVLEVGHVAVGARVQRIDDHLRIDRAGDLDAAVEQGRRDVRDPPVAIADGAGVGTEIGQAAAVEEGLAVAARGQQLLAPWFETAMQAGEEVQRRWRQQSRPGPRPWRIPRWSRLARTP